MLVYYRGDRVVSILNLCHIYLVAWQPTMPSLRGAGTAARPAETAAPFDVLRIFDQHPLPATCIKQASLWSLNDGE